jgi:hypothetical protein
MPHPVTCTHMHHWNEDPMHGHQIGSIRPALHAKSGKLHPIGFMGVPSRAMGSVARATSMLSIRRTCESFGMAAHAEGG